MSPNSLETLGLIFLAVIVFFIAKFVFNVLYSYAIGPAINKVDFKSKGKWALVTGCTDGIGKQYALELAARGCDIILVSRSLDKLKATAQLIENQHKVSTKIIQVDFTEGEDIYAKIEKEIENIEIGTLVNNVGVSYTYPEYFLDLSDSEKLMSTMIRANIVSLTRMVKLVMPSMLERKRGVIINIGSGSSIIPSPLLTGYAATKAYVEKFTEGLEMEYSNTGIIIQCVMPGFVCSNMSGITKSSLFAPTAEQFVKSAIALVGTQKKTTGYLPHSFFLGIIQILYNISYNFSVWLIRRTSENTRRKYLRKYGSK